MPLLASASLKLFLLLLTSPNSCLKHLDFQRPFGLNGVHCFFDSGTAPHASTFRGPPRALEPIRTGEGGGRSPQNWEFFGATTSGEWFCLLPRRERLTCCSLRARTMSPLPDKKLPDDGPYPFVPFTRPHSYHFETRGGS